MASTASLQDNFDDDSRDTGIWLASLSAAPGFFPQAVGIDGTVTETDGLVRLTGAVSNPDDDCNGYYSQDAALDMTSSEMVLQLVTVPTTSGQSTLLAFGGDQGSAQYYRFTVENAFGTVNLVMRSNLSGNAGADEGGTVTITWSATDHRWLRIRHDTAAGGTIYWDTAPDNSGSPGTWTNRRTLTSASTGYFSPTSLQIGFVMCQLSSNASPHTYEIDNFNVTDAGGSSVPVLSFASRQLLNN